MKLSDFLLIALVLLLFGCVVFFKPFASGNTYFEVKTPQGSYVYPLSQDATYTFDGLLGESVIQVKDGTVFFEDSPCPNKNCISEGAVSKPGAFNACLPNGISITITGETKVDGVSI